jgi:serine/threonine protein kinase
MKPQPFGRYLLLDKVASGGMAEVWRAKLSGEQGFQRIYAIKKILPHVAEDQDFITMFTDEAHITSSLQHANVAQVYEFAKTDDTYYLAMEYVSGKDLKGVWSYLRSRKTIMPVEIAAFIVQRLAEGLDYAHRRTDNFGQDAGIVHRDVSPQNVLLSWDGEVKVIDFGIARAIEKAGRTRPGTLKGKFAYMSPEQIRGLPLDGRADIFSIGVVLYELCTGERGFSADSEFSLLEMVRNVEIRPPSVVNRDLPSELERIIYKALAKDREHRYQLASELADDLQRFLLERGPPPSRHDLARFLRENFTVDFERERGRLESYKEMSGEDRTRPLRRPATGPINPVLDDSSSDETAAFAVVAKTRPDGDSDAFGDHVGELDDARPDIRPAARSRPVVDATSQAAAAPVTATRRTYAPPQPELDRSRFKAFAAALTATIFVGAAVVVGFFLLRGSGTGTVVVTVSGAPTAMVRFDDRNPATAEPSLTIERVRSGTHAIIVENPGFITFTTSLVTEKNVPVYQIKAPLKRHSGKLRIASEPGAARVVLDGKDTELTTPASLDVEGETLHEVTLRLDGFKDSRRAGVKVAAAQEQLVEFRLVPEKVKITIDTRPPGAELAINGQPIGTAPVTISREPDDNNFPKVVATMKGCTAKESTLAFDGSQTEQTITLEMNCRARAVP